MSIIMMNEDGPFVGYECMSIARTYEDDSSDGYLGNLNV